MKTGDWRLVVCGVTHKTSTLEQRERLTLSRDDMAAANALFGSLAEVLESAIVSTCNRVEFYFVTGETEPFDVVAAFYKKFRDLDILPIKEVFRTKKGRHTGDHLFRVAAGIDSMVLGENEILGQLRNAYKSACAVKSAGKVIHSLFHQAFRVGKRVRTDTRIGEGACSVSTAVVEMLLDTMEALESPTVLFVGINHMIDLAAGRLKRRNHCRLLFANRTAEKASAYAAGKGSEGFGLDKLPDLMTEADIVVSCTSSSEPIITRQMMADVLARRPAGRLVIADMAVPRDVDIPKGWNPEVEVFDLEDIKKFSESRQQKRELAIPKAEEIIERRVDEFDYWYGHVLHEPIYNGQSGTIESLREEELAPILEKLQPELRDELNEATRRIVNRVLRVANRTAAKQPE